MFRRAMLDFNDDLDSAEEQHKWFPHEIVCDCCHTRLEKIVRCREAHI